MAVNTINFDKAKISKCRNDRILSRNMLNTTKETTLTNMFLSLDIMSLTSSILWRIVFKALSTSLSLAVDDI